MRQVEFCRHNIAVLLPNHIISNGEYSADYSITLIIVAKSFYDELVSRESFRGYLKYKNQPNHQLSDEQFDKVTTIISIIRLVSENDHPKRREMLANLLDILFYALTRYRGEEEQPTATESRNTNLFNRFYDLLINNYHKEHRTGWYADNLCLTPKYLSKIICDTTGKSASEWINEVIILHAKRLLRTRTDLTIQQIAYELGFVENASFCRFFRHETGMTPSEYRNK